MAKKQEGKKEKKKSRLATIGWIVLIVFIHFCIVFFMKVLGKYSYATIFIFLFLSWVIIGFFVFLIWFFVVRKKTMDKKEFELTKEEAEKFALDKLLKEKGLIPRRQFINTLKTAGKDTELKEPYFFLIFEDVHNSNLMIGYYQNLKRISVSGILSSEEDESLKEFKNRVVAEMNETISPTKEKESFIEEKYDSFGNIIGRRIGTIPTIKQVTQETTKKDEVDVQ